MVSFESFIIGLDGTIVLFSYSSVISHSISIVHLQDTRFECFTMYRCRLRPQHSSLLRPTMTPITVRSEAFYIGESVSSSPHFDLSLLPLPPPDQAELLHSPLSSRALLPHSQSRKRSPSSLIGKRNSSSY